MKPSVPYTRCPTCGHVDATTVCKFDSTDKLPPRPWHRPAPALTTQITAKGHDHVTPAERLRPLRSVR